MYKKQPYKEDKLNAMLACRKMIQIQTMRLSSLNALAVSSRKNILLTHEEAESGAVTADDLGKQLVGS